MPNLDFSDFSEDASYFKEVVDYAFLIPDSKKSGENDMVLTFGEAGRFMGNEFYRGWLQSTGFEITALIEGKWEKVYHAFLSSTTLANHLITCEQDGQSNNNFFNHQALTLEQLEYRLSDLFNSIETFEFDTVPTSKSEPKEKKPANKTLKYCPVCGAPLPPGAKFCTECGAKLSDYGIG
jgi:hypothetical protein